MILIPQDVVCVRIAKTLVLNCVWKNSYVMLSCILSQALKRIKYLSKVGHIP